MGKKTEVLGDLALPGNVRVPVTLTSRQHDILSEAARGLGLTISAYMRMAALSDATKLMAPIKMTER